MEAHLLLGGISIVLAFLAGVLLVFGQGGRRRRHDAVEASSGVSGTRSGRLAWRLRNGYPALIPASRYLMRVGRVDDFAHEAAWMLSRHRYATSAHTLLSVALVMLVAAALLVGMLTGSVVSAVALVACVVAVAFSAVGAARDKRLEAEREAVPDILRSMGVCFDAGLTLLQTCHQIAKETRGSLRVPFGRAASLLETGSGASEALAELKKGSMVQELAFVVVALDVQHQAGGSLRQVLDAARDMVEGELALKRSLKVQTAQAKLSARVVSVMPFVLVALFSLLSEGFLTPFFESAAGYALLALALGMQVAGIGMVRRLQGVEVGA